jgi:hypothetical protein
MQSALGERHQGLIFGNFDQYLAMLTILAMFANFLAMLTNVKVC